MIRVSNHSERYIRKNSKRTGINGRNVFFGVIPDHLVIYGTRNHLFTTNKDRFVKIVKINPRIGLNQIREIVREGRINTFKSESVHDSIDRNPVKTGF